MYLGGSCKNTSKKDSRSSVVIRAHQHVNASILVDQMGTTKSPRKADRLCAYDYDAEYTAICGLLVEFGNSSSSVCSLLEGQSDSHVVGCLGVHEAGGDDRTTPSEDGLSDVRKCLGIRKDKAYLDVCRSSAFDKTIDLHNVSVGARTRSLDAYPPGGGGFSECALN